jgi:hypothetical protein
MKPAETIRAALNAHSTMHNPGWNQPCRPDCTACLRAAALAALEQIEQERERLRWIPAGETEPPKDGAPVLVRNDRGVFCVVWQQYEIEWWHVKDGKNEPRPMRGSAPTHWFPVACLDAAMGEPAPALTPDEIRGAAGTVCSTCGLADNIACSNPWHLRAIPPANPNPPKGSGGCECPARVALKDAARDLYESWGMLRAALHPDAECVYRSHQAALKSSETPCPCEEMREEVAAAKQEAAARVKQNVTQIEIHERNTKEWRVALDSAEADRNQLRAEVDGLRDEYGAIISNLAATLFPNSDPDSARAEFLLDAAGACQVIERIRTENDRLRNDVQAIGNTMQAAVVERDQLSMRLSDCEEMGRLRWKQRGHEELDYPGGPLAAYDILLHEAEDERNEFRAKLADVEQAKQNLSDWIKAANQFAWAHERTCPRRTANEACNCGLDAFMCRPRPFIESLKQRADSAEARAAKAEQDVARLTTLRPASEYHEDYGAVVWWHVPVCEPPYVGPGEGMGESDMYGEPTTCARLQRDGWLTHFTELPNISGDDEVKP